MPACPRGFPLPAPFLANVLIRRFAAAGAPLNQAQLHKVLYLAHGHLLGRFGVHLTLGLPKAGPYGPVYDGLALRDRGNRVLTRPPFADWTSDLAGAHQGGHTDGTTEAFLQAIVQAYAGRSTRQLMEMIHAPKDPWKQSRAAGLTWVNEQVMRADFTAVHIRAQARRAAAA